MTKNLRRATVLIFRVDFVCVLLGHDWIIYTSVGIRLSLPLKRNKEPKTHATPTNKIIILRSEARTVVTCAVGNTLHYGPPNRVTNTPTEDRLIRQHRNPPATKTKQQTPSRGNSLYLYLLLSERNTSIGSLNVHLQSPKTTTLAEVHVIIACGRGLDIFSSGTKWCVE